MGSRVIPHTKHDPCLVCGGYRTLPRGTNSRCHGFVSSDRRYVHCSREEQAGLLERGSDGLFSHRIEGRCRCGADHRKGLYVRREM
jgi:hypothetical protein